MVKTKVLMFVALMLIIPELILAAEKPDITSAKYDQYGYPVRNVSTAGIRKLLINRDFSNLNKLLEDYQKEFENDFRYEYIFSIDWVLAQIKQWDTIIAYWTKYIKLESKDGRAYRERGGAYYQKGDLKAALADAKRAADLGDEEGRKQYERLKNVVE